MKKIMFLMSCILLISANAFSQGDLEVNGSMGVGDTPEASIKLKVMGTNAAGGVVKSTIDQPGFAVATGLNLTSEVAGVSEGLATSTVTSFLIGS